MTPGCSRPSQSFRLRSRNWLYLLPLLLPALLFPSPALRAQSRTPPLSRARDVLALSDADASAGTRSVSLRGVVVDVSPDGGELSLHDGESCLSVRLKEGLTPPPLAAQIDVAGLAVSEPFLERRRTRVLADHISLLGPGTLPSPLSVTLESAARFQHLDQWVSLEGTVLQVRSSMSLFTIQLVAGSVSCNVLVRDWPRESLPRDWIGGRVRVTGVNRAYLPGSSFLAVVVPSPAQVAVLKTGSVDPFDAPTSSISALRAARPSPPERVKLSATLLAATSGNVFYARDPEGGAFSFYLLHPIDEDKSGRFSTPIVIPRCQPGDQLEIVGSPGRLEPGVHLDFGVARVLSQGPVPAPVAADIATVKAGEHVHDLVELHGRLLSLDDVLVAPGRWRTTMKLADSDQTIIAFLDAPSRGALSHLAPDHLLSMRGIVTGAPHFPEIRLWVPSAADLQSLGVAANALTRRLWAGLAVAALVVILLSGWAFLLRRSRAGVRKLNATLEDRVAARTAELAAAKDELARALSQERDLNELKTRFVSLVSHEFRTPLGVTMSAVEVLRHYAERLSPEKRAELLDDIHSSTLQMSGLMEQVLLLGRAEAGKIVWRPAPVDLPELCERLIDEARSASHQRCPVRFHAEGDFTGALMDEALLRHIISNLLSNALKYSPQGSPVDFSLRQVAGDAVLTFQDHGIGIPLADQARLFEAFHRASNVGETPGTGLGLLLVKHCVDLHQGSIEVLSQEGSGATFTVRLPLRRAP